MPLKHGKNLYKLKFDLPDAKLWDLETPYLYQLHAAVLVNGTCTDRLAQQFGMRSFTQDTESPQRKGDVLSQWPLHPSARSQYDGL